MYMTFNKQKWSREYYLKNRDRILARNKKWNKEHSEIMARISREWAKRNPEKAKQAWANYNKRNPEKRKLQWKKYRDTHKEKLRKDIREYFRENPSAQHRYKVKNAIGRFSSKEWEELKKVYGCKCAICKKKRKLTVDHIIPLSKEGTNFISNIQPLCKPCNSSKNNR